jgi:hypothetical protein
MKRVLPFLLIALVASVAFPATAQSFSLTSPTGSPVLRDLGSDLTAFSWTPLAGATSYELSLFKISNNTRFGLVFTGTVNSGECSQTQCLYVPTGGNYSSIDRGGYAWTVIASTPGGDVEAGNAPAYFSFDDEDIQLVENPGFQSGELTPWVASGLTGDKLKDDKGNGGGWAFLFKGSAGENAKLKQTQNVAKYGIDASDMLQLSVDYRATSGTVDAKFVAKIIYTAASGLPKDKVSLIASQHSDYTTAQQSAAPVGPVQQVQVQIKHKSPGGKLFVDNVHLTLLAVP